MGLLSLLLVGGLLLIVLLIVLLVVSFVRLLVECRGSSCRRRSLLLPLRLIGFRISTRIRLLVNFNHLHLADWSLLRVIRLHAVRKVVWVLSDSSGSSRTYSTGGNVSILQLIALRARLHHLLV